MVSSLGAANFEIGTESRARQALFFRQLLRAMFQALHIGPEHAEYQYGRGNQKLVPSPSKITKALSSILPLSVLSASDVRKIFDPTDAARFRREFMHDIGDAQAIGGSTG